MLADCIGKFKAGTSGASIVTEGIFIELPSFIFFFFVSALAARNRTFHATGEGVFFESALSFVVADHLGKFHAWVIGASHA